MRFFVALAGAAILTTTVAGSASAHHSYAAFDRSKKVTMTGTVKSWEWTNPHTWLTISVPDPKKKGAMQDWAFEGLAPGTLRPRGWSRLMVKPGDKVAITMNPRRDGTNGGTLVSLTLPDGKVYGDPAGAAPGGGPGGA
jgi:hypothetical protein